MNRADEPMISDGIVHNRVAKVVNYRRWRRRRQAVSTALQGEVFWILQSLVHLVCALAHFEVGPEFTLWSHSAADQCDAVPSFEQTVESWQRFARRCFEIHERTTEPRWTICLGRRCIRRRLKFRAFASLFFNEFDGCCWPRSGGWSAV